MYWTDVRCGPLTIFFLFIWRKANLRLHVPRVINWQQQLVELVHYFRLKPKGLGQNSCNFLKIIFIFHQCTLYSRGELHWVSASQAAGKKASCYEDFTEIRDHRINTARKEKGWGRLFFPQIGPNCPLPYSTTPEPCLRDARPAGWVTYLQCMH